MSFHLNGFSVPALTIEMDGIPGSSCPSHVGILSTDPIITITIVDFPRVKGLCKSYNRDNGERDGRACGTVCGNDTAQLR